MVSGEKRERVSQAPVELPVVPELPGVPELLELPGVPEVPEPLELPKPVELPEPVEPGVALPPNELLVEPLSPDELVPKLPPPVVADGAKPVLGVEVAVELLKPP
jgi:hypothetical protein